MVCDSIMECPGWKDSWNTLDGVIKDHCMGLFFRGIHKLAIDPFIYCPWCGKELDWINWERLKGGD